MKAAVYTRYGPPRQVLEIRDVEAPVPGSGEVLVQVRAASVNPLDSHMMVGRPYAMRAAFGLPHPTVTRPGVDLAGRVEAVGANVTRFRPGDEVFGASQGTFAELVCAKETRLALKPANVTFEQAAAVNVAGLTALQGLRDHGRIRSGHRVLIHGASGGVGTFAVQIAKSLGAEVTGVCSTGNLDLVRSIGADHVVDYTREDFTRSRRPCDLLLDCVADRSLRARRRLVGPEGRYVVVGLGPMGGRWVGPLARILEVVALSLVARNVVMFVATSSVEDLAFLREQLGAGQVIPVIDRCYSLSDVAEAVGYVRQGHARGKVVIQMP